MKYDFSGYATKNDVTCGDGRIIRKNAFKDNDGMTVPLVWQHIHNDPANVLGHAELENRDDGVYAYCSFNDTPTAQTAKSLVQHGDVASLSIYANRLKQQGNNVIHGLIREVSLVLAGANPEAVIDPLTIQHDDGSYTDLEDEAVIRLNLPLSLAHDDFSENLPDEEEEDVEDEELSHDDDEDEDDDVANQNGKTVGDVLKTFTSKERKVLEYLIGISLMNESERKNALNESASVQHADEETIEDVINSMSDEKKKVLYFLVSEALKDKGSGDVSHDDLGEYDMHRNVFDETANDNTEVLSHDDMAEILADAPRYGSLKEACLQHGIENLEILFPEAKSVNGNTPEFIKRDTGWVSDVWNGVHKSPFARIKTVNADITEYEARARGYIKGNQKIEEIFGLLARVTTPQTVYKLQKLDRDDIIDITDFDVVAWMRGEMRMMLEEELAGAILIDDGRPSTDPSKIKNENIRPIYTDDELYTIHKNVTISSSMTNSQISDLLIETVLLARKDYKGSGNPAMYASSDIITRMLLAKDQIGRRLYPDMNALATALRVSKIVEVPILEGATRSYTENGSVVTATLLALFVNLNDYNIGADKGGAVSMFDDFDLNYNKYEYLIETRCSGALTKPKSAIALETTGTLPFEFGPRSGAYRASRPSSSTTPTTEEPSTDEGGEG